LKAEFIKSAVYAKDYPEHSLPEVAFIGRSNVGKSSMINALVNRKNLVKTSSKPGKTRLINFFNINDKICFVDLPGYGYAKVSKSEKQLWNKMIEMFLKERENLKSCVLILDIRRVPSKEDIQMFEWLLYYNILPIVVATKCDKLSNNKIAKQSKIIKKEIKCENLLLFSAVNKKGITEVWNEIEKKIFD
jgi:GTP-binding protein